MPVAQDLADLVERRASARAWRWRRCAAAGARGPSPAAAGRDAATRCDAASRVITAPARSVKALSRSRTAGISFDFAATATCPSTAPMPVRDSSDQVRRGRVFGAGTADGLAVDRDHQPAGDLGGSGPQPRTQNRAQPVSIDRGERPAERGLLRRPTPRAQRQQCLGTGIGCPLTDRSERTRPSDHRRDPDRQQPSHAVSPSTLLAGIRDLAQQINQVLAPGSRHRRRCHRRVGSSWRRW